MTNIFSNRIAQGVAAIVAIAAIFVGYQAFTGEDTATTAEATTEASTTTTNVTTATGDDNNTANAVAPVDVVDGVGSTLENENTATDNTTDAVGE